MAEWLETEIGGVLRFIGWNPSRADTLVTQAQDSIDLIQGGMSGETHAGVTRPSCSRVKNLYLFGTEILNMRQLSVLSVEELHAIASDMGLERLPPEWLGANLVFEGIPSLSLLPPNSRLQFDSGATIGVSTMNGPCKYPAQVIAERYPEHAKRFVKSALGRRGFTGFVVREGTVTVGMRARLFVPGQPKHPLFS